MIEKTASLRKRLIGAMVGLFVCGSMVLYVGAREYGRKAADASYDRLLAGSAISIAETLSVSQGVVLVDIPYASLDMLSAAPDDRVFYHVFGPHGGDVTGYSDLPKFHISKRDFLLEPNRVHYFNAAYRGEDVRFALWGREIEEPGIAGRVWVQVGQSNRARHELANEIVVRSLLAMGLLSAVALTLMWFAISHALKPLERASRELAHRDPSDLQPIRTPVPLEISVLVTSLNDFMGRLRKNMDAQRMFIADAAHQMRTPLAGLRAQAQLAIDDDSGDRLASLRTIERIASRLSRLLNQLLSDATVHHRSGIREAVPIDLVSVISRAIRDAVPISDHVQVKLHTDLREAPLMGDALMIGEAIKNLIDNSLRHGDDGHGTVDISLACGDGYVIEVSDRGPGLRGEGRDRLFGRFERGNSASSGAGLGLAIVRQAVESHKGSVRIADREGGGLTVVIRLPGVQS